MGLGFLTIRGTSFRVPIISSNVFFGSIFVFYM